VDNLGGPETFLRCLHFPLLKLAIMPEEPRKPDWSSEESTLSVQPGVPGGHDGMPGQTAAGTFSRAPAQPRRRLAVEDYVAGVRSGDTTLLARAITLIESNAPAHRPLASEVLRQLLPHAGNSVRIGITGVPGAGKSTFIEAFGLRLCELGKRVAVLAVDPSSAVSGGSILGDKVRMERLSRESHAFIRPSPSSGMLGGVTRKSRETIVLCEAAGFDVILVETVGVGQSEVTVRSMVDFFLLLMIAGAGDEIQGIKKGVIELADALVVNKADGENLPRAKATHAEFSRVLRYLHPVTPGWETRALLASALTGSGVSEVWQMIDEFAFSMRASGFFAARRQQQNLAWMRALVEEELKSRFFARPDVRSAREKLEAEVAVGRLPPATAASQLLSLDGKA
jgi:LAO/AO transport system kinase